MSLVAGLDLGHDRSSWSLYVHVRGDQVVSDEATGQDAVFHVHPWSALLDTRFCGPGEHCSALGTVREEAQVLCGAEGDH